MNIYTLHFLCLIPIGNKAILLCKLSRQLRILCKIMKFNLKTAGHHPYLIVGQFQSLPFFSKYPLDHMSTKTLLYLILVYHPILSFFVFPDKKYETIILPIFGIPSPFHISTIKVSDLFLFITIFCLYSKSITKQPFLNQTLLNQQLEVGQQFYL